MQSSLWMSKKKTPTIITIQLYLRSYSYVVDKKELRFCTDSTLRIFTAHWSNMVALRKAFDIRLWSQQKKRTIYTCKHYFRAFECWTKRPNKLCREQTEEPLSISLFQNNMPNIIMIPRVFGILFFGFESVRQCYGHAKVTHTVHGIVNCCW